MLLPSPLTTIFSFKKLYAVIGIGLLLSACEPPNQASSPQPPLPQSTATANSEANQIPTKNQSHLTKASVSNGEEIAKRLEISYARNAAYKKNECPKLVEFESINQTITREGEQLPSDYCEYFVFLNQGDTLSIRTSDAMHAKLVSPLWFDFDNGSYTAPKFDKYTIRLSYDGVRYHPVNFRYDVSLVKSSIKSN